MYKIKYKMYFMFESTLSIFYKIEVVVSELQFGFSLLMHFLIEYFIPFQPANYSE